mmetsp:Transcript_5117/g.12804  ORF Transcript_5117/g.12804 Transcript_5117/m.12804 type:complete len:269 (-) Transcript_5117:65-871(-)
MAAAVIKSGQHVAAKVPYTKRTDEWILATVRHYVPDTEQYMVKDLHPDSSKKEDTWFVHDEFVYPFPSPNTESYRAGDRVLSLWYLPDDDQWSTMLYEAVVTRSAGVSAPMVALRFDGDDSIYETEKSKIVKLLKNKRTGSPLRGLVSQKRIRMNENSDSEDSSDDDDDEEEDDDDDDDDDNNSSSGEEDDSSSDTDESDSSEETSDDKDEDSLSGSADDDRPHTRMELLACKTNFFQRCTCLGAEWFGPIGKKLVLLDEWERGRTRK